MTERPARAVAIVLSILVFCVGWAVVAARPWSATKADPRLAALTAREQRLRSEAKLVARIVAQREALARAALARKAAQTAPSTQTVAAPAVRVVNLPPLTITRTS